MGQQTSGISPKKQEVSKSFVHKCKLQHTQYGIHLILNAFEKEVANVSDLNDKKNMVKFKFNIYNHSNLFLPDAIKNIVAKYCKIPQSFMRDHILNTTKKINCDLLFKALLLGLVFRYFLCVACFFCFFCLRKFAIQQSLQTHRKLLGGQIKINDKVR